MSSGVFQFVRARFMHACICARLCVRACIHQTGNWQAADPLWVVFIFHSLPVSSHKALAFSFFFPFIFSFIPFSSQYLPGYNCDMNHFRQGEAQRCGGEKTLLQKKQKKNLEKEKLYFDSHGASNWLSYNSSLCHCSYFLSNFREKHKHLSWEGGKMRCSLQRLSIC